MERLFSEQKRASARLRIEPIAHRKERLRKLRSWILDNRQVIHEAMYKDFRKPAAEVDAIEIFHVLNEIRSAENNLDQWAAPRKVDAPITMAGTRSHIQYEPRGVCLIISPWNYPFSLAVGPLVSALAAGNTAILKPSELSAHVSVVIRTMASELFDPSIVSVVLGGPEISEQLTRLPFDHIFFTGSPAIGKKVMKAAAENLTSVTLELGGKSPAIVTASAKSKEAASRIAVAKFVNNGQTCIAPDYVLVDETIAEEFITFLIQKTKDLFAPDGNFEASASYCRIVNDRHFNRLNELLQDCLNQGAKLDFGGKTDSGTRFMHPMVLSQVPPDCRLMTEEIFGPILPVLTYRSLDEAIAIINNQPKALALYVFTRQKSLRKKILTETSSGTACVNDCGIQFLQHHLPFGGVNNSGIGKSHGHFGFLAFSNEKPVLIQKHGFTSVRLFYPPYTHRTRKLLDWILKLI